MTLILTNGMGIVKSVSTSDSKEINAEIKTQTKIKSKIKKDTTIKAKIKR